jgi:hypothetical protein
MQPSFTGVGGACEAASADAVIGFGICRGRDFMKAFVKDALSDVEDRPSCPACAEGSETEKSSFVYRDVFVFVRWRVNGEGVGDCGDEAACALNSF